MDARDRVAEDGVKRGEEEGVRRRVHDEQGETQKQDLQGWISRAAGLFFTSQNIC